MSQFKKIDELDKEIARYVIESGRLGEEILSLRREGYPDYHKNLKTRLHNYYRVNGIIKKLEKEKIELMNKYLQDSMKTLELMGIVLDSNTYLGRDVWVRTSNGEQIKGKVLREEGERVYVVNPHNGQTAWRFKREVEFVKDNDATENGALEGNIGNNKEIESMPLEKDPVQAQDEDPKAELIKYAEATKDPDYIKYVKGMKNQANINARLQWHRQKERNMKDMLKLCGIV